jgi:hypothetical protein
MGRYLYLDTFAAVRVASDAAFASAARAYILSENFVLVQSTMNLVEIFSWPQRWPDVVSFVSSVPFCIAQNTDKITACEIASYPDELTSLPVGFCSSDHSFSADELVEAIYFHLKGKIADFARDYRSENEEALQAILSQRESFLPERPERYSASERKIFIDYNVLKMLLKDHPDFVDRARQKGVVNVERFKSFYMQMLAIFLEYYVQKKKGKSSDMGDILQLSLVPYVDLAVLDNERNNLVQRINRDSLFPGYLQACSWSDFKAKVAKTRPMVDKE